MRVVDSGLMMVAIWDREVQVSWALELVVRDRNAGGKGEGENRMTNIE